MEHTEIMRDFDDQKDMVDSSKSPVGKGVFLDEDGNVIPPSQLHESFYEKIIPTVEQQELLDVKILPQALIPSGVSVEPHNYNFDKSECQIIDFRNDKRFNKILNRASMPGSKNGTKRIRKVIAMKIVRLIKKSIDYDLSPEDEVMLLDKIQRRFVNDEESSKTYLNSFFINSDIGIILASEDDEYLNPLKDENGVIIKDENGNIINDSPFGRKHRNAYGFNIHFNKGDSYVRNVYKSGTEDNFLNKKITLIFDGQQRLTMMSIFFGGGSFGVNDEDQSSDKKRYPYLDLKHIKVEISNQDNYIVRLSPEALSKPKTGLVYLSNDEYDFIVSKTKNMHLIKTSEFGKLDEYIKNPNNIVDYIGDVLESWKLKYGIYATPEIQYTYGIFIQYMYEKLFVAETCMIHVDYDATAETNAQTFEKQSYSSVLHKEDMIEGGLNSKSDTMFGIKIADKIALEFIKFGVSKEKDANIATMRLLISGLHRNSKIKSVGNKKIDKFWNCKNISTFYGDGTTNTLETLFINDESEKIKFTHHFMRYETELMKALDDLRDLVYVNKNSEFRSEYKWIETVDSITKIDVFHFIFIGLFNKIIGGSKKRLFGHTKKHDGMESKRTAKLIEGMFRLNPIDNDIPTEISSRRKTYTMISRTLVANKLSFNVVNLKKVLQSDVMNISYNPYMSNYIDREYTRQSDNSFDTLYLEAIYNVHGTQGDHIHDFASTKTLLKTQKKVKSMFVSYRLNDIYLEYLARMIFDFNDTIIGKMPLETNTNNVKSNTLPHEFFEDHTTEDQKIHIRNGYNLPVSLYSDDDVIQLLKPKNILSLWTHNSLSLLRAKNKLNIEIAGEFKDDYVERVFDSSIAFDIMLKNMKLEETAPLLYSFLHDENNGTKLTKNNIIKLVKL